MRNKPTAPPSHQLLLESHETQFYHKKESILQSLKNASMSEREKATFVKFHIY